MIHVLYHDRSPSKTSANPRTIINGVISSNLLVVTFQKNEKANPHALNPLSQLTSAGSGLCSCIYTAVGGCVGCSGWEELLDVGRSSSSLPLDITWLLKMHVMKLLMCGLTDVLWKKLERKRDTERVIEWGRDNTWGFVLPRIHQVYLKFSLNTWKSSFESMSLTSKDGNKFM